MGTQNALLNPIRGRLDHVTGNPLQAVSGESPETTRQSSRSSLRSRPHTGAARPVCTASSSTMQDSSDPNASAYGFRAPTGRRRFLSNAGRALGLVALGGAWPAWRLITRNEAAAPLRRSSWAMGTSVNLSLPGSPMVNQHAVNRVSKITPHNLHNRNIH